MSAASSLGLCAALLTMPEGLPEPGASEAQSFTALDLARWGLLDAARRESVRDQLMGEVGLPPPVELEVLQQQWAHQRGWSSLLQGHAWLEQQGLPSALLADLASRSWRWQRWCERQYAGGVASAFLARKAGLDQLRFWCLSCTDAELASELYLRLREGEIDFDQLVQHPDHGQAWHVELVGPVPLERVPPAQAALLRVSQPGHLWAPRPLAEACWQILRLEERLPAVLGEELRQQLIAEQGERALDQALAQPQLTAPVCTQTSMPS
jgi:hypothetical protein